MSNRNLNQVLTQGLKGPKLGDGMIWDSFSEDGIFIQAPKMGEEWRLEKALSVYSNLDTEDVPMPDILGYQESGPAYLAFEGLDGSTVKEIGKNIKDDADREEFLGYMRQAGEALARIHSADGVDYGNPNIGDWSVEGSHQDWPSYVESHVEYAAEYTEEEGLKI